MSVVAEQIFVGFLCSCSTLLWYYESYDYVSTWLSCIFRRTNKFSTLRGVCVCVTHAYHLSKKTPHITDTFCSAQLVTPGLIMILHKFSERPLKMV